MLYQLATNADTGASEFRIDCATFTCSYNGKAFGCEIQEMLIWSPGLRTSRCTSGIHEIRVRKVVCPA